MRNSLKRYQSIQNNQVLESSPHQLIAIILQNVLSCVAVAKIAINNQDIETKGKNINKATALIGELITSLNIENGGDIATNLGSLYDYSIRQLSEAHLTNNIEALDEVSFIFKNIKEGWDNIADVSN